MLRLFVAIRPPDRVRDTLLAVMGGVSGARWQTDEQLHLTLRFIGEVDRHRAGDIDAALGSVHHPRFAISIEGLGTFDRRGRPEVIWAGVSPQEPVKSLQKKVTKALERVGLPPEQRAYLPHITLARLNRSSGTVGNLLEQSGGLRSDLFTVESFALFESRLTPDGAVYPVLERYPLG